MRLCSGENTNNGYFDIQRLTKCISENILGLEINLDLDYKRGKERNLEEHENSFSIIIKPYEFENIALNTEEPVDEDFIDIPVIRKQI